MPGFIALKLCPHLKFVKGNFAKYEAAAEEARRVFATVDPAFVSRGLDEASLCITSYCEQTGLAPSQVCSPALCILITDSDVCRGHLDAAAVDVGRCSSSDDGRISRRRLHHAIGACMQSRVREDGMTETLAHPSNECKHAAGAGGGAHSARSAGTDTAYVFCGYCTQQHARKDLQRHQQAQRPVRGGAHTRGCHELPRSALRAQGAWHRQGVATLHMHAGSSGRAILHALGVQRPRAHCRCLSSC
jgi:hypothetical protein